MFAPESALAELPTERLEHEITELAAHLSAGCCRWLELVGEFDRRGVWADYGCRSAAEWVAWQCALTSRAAREHVRVARRLAELPLIHRLFASGELSFSKVRALSRVAEAESEEELVELARHATASQLERIVRGLRRVSADQAEEQQRRRYLLAFWEEDGTLSIRGRLPSAAITIARARPAVPRNRLPRAVPRNRHRRLTRPTPTPSWSWPGAAPATRSASKSTSKRSPTTPAARCG